MPSHVIVCGFHRSGTSMTMQTLVAAGLPAGESMIGADPSNADGHYEDIETVRLHDRWLAEHGSDWCHAGPLPQPEEGDARRSIQAISERLGRAGDTWGLKDPRATLFLPNWFEVLEHPVGVFVYRHFASCLRSLQRRQADELMLLPDSSPAAIRFWSDPSAALLSWQTHNDALLACLKSHPGRCVLVSQEALLCGAPLASLVRGAVGVPLDQASNSGVDAGKSVTPSSVFLPDSMLAADLSRTWDQLQGNSAAPAPDSSIPALEFGDSLASTPSATDGQRDRLRSLWAQVLGK